MHNKLLNRSSLVVVAIGLLAVISLSQALLKGWRLDLTENRVYTLSEGTRNILDKLEEPLQLYFFYNREATRDVPQLQTYATRVQELLEELSLYSGDKLKLNLIAPEAFSPEEDRAVELGVQAVPINDAGDNLYFGLAGTNTVDDVQTIPFFQPSRGNLLEYDIAKLIYALANPVKRKVGVMSVLDIAGGFDPRSMRPTPPWMAIEQLREFFEVEEIDPATASIAEDIEVLVLVHPADLGEPTRYAIDQFVLRGGKAVVFVDPYAESVAPRSMTDDGPSPNSDLAPLLSAWGVTLSPDILGDGANALQVQTQAGAPPAFHLGLLGLDADSLNADDVVTQDLDSLNLGLAGILSAAEGASTRFTPLIQSSDQSAPIPAFRIQPGMDPSVLLNNFAPTGERYAIAARVSGPAASAYGEAAPEGVDGSGHLSQSSGDIQVIVVADSDLLTDRYWVQVQDFLGQRIASPFAGNGDFLLNAVDNLLGSADVIGIKGRAGYARPFTRIEAMKREADARFRQTEQRLQDRLRETEAKLAELQDQRGDGNALTLTAEQRREVERFREEQLQTRRELRDVRHSLNKDIDRLETLLKFVNIGLVPVLIILLALVAGLRRRTSA